MCCSNEKASLDPSCSEYEIPFGHGLDGRNEPPKREVFFYFPQLLSLLRKCNSYRAFLVHGVLNHPKVLKYMVGMQCCEEARIVTRCTQVGTSLGCTALVYG